jgi:hypothetical protein
MLKPRHIFTFEVAGWTFRYSIEIRYSHYHRVARKKAEYFADAQSCFESMREKLSPCDTWKAFFGEGPATLEVGHKVLRLFFRVDPMGLMTVALQSWLWRTAYH